MGIYYMIWSYTSITSSSPGLASWASARTRPPASRNRRGRSRCRGRPRGKISRANVAIIIIIIITITITITTTPTTTTTTTISIIIIICSSSTVNINIIIHVITHIITMISRAKTFFADARSAKSPAESRADARRPRVSPLETLLTQAILSSCGETQLVDIW